MLNSSFDCRRLVPELMDDPTLSEGLHLHALRGLQRINRWTGNAHAAWRPIRALSQSMGSRALTVLDVATGSGDVPRAIRQYALAAGVPVDIEACDISDRAIGMAKQGFQTEDSKVHFFKHDVVNDAFHREYDVVMCATFFHHLSDTEALLVLSKMRDAARHRIIIVDLLRSRANWWQVWFASHALSRSKIVHFDGPQSVRAAFTMPEMLQLAEQAQLQNIQLRKRWPCRFVLVGSR